MNPPVRAKADRDALIEGLLDGTIDCIATDHAPHAATEKAGGLQNSLMGVTGLECAFAALHTKLVRTGIVPLLRLFALMIDKPRERFGLPARTLEAGQPADLAVLDLDREWVIRSEQFLSKGRATPFDGMRVIGDCILTMAGGEIVWRE